MNQSNDFIEITSSGIVKRRWLSAGGVIARGPRRSGGGVFSLSIVFHISTRFFALPIYLKKHRLSCVWRRRERKGKRDKIVIQYRVEEFQRHVQLVRPVCHDRDWFVWFSTVRQAVLFDPFQNKFLHVCHFHVRRSRSPRDMYIYIYM